MTGSAGPLGIFGGAFDPVHFGHLRCAVEVRENFDLDEVLFMPSGNPPHRSPHLATAEQRKAMLLAATADLKGCRIDDRELLRDGPSWSVVTLQELRDENPQRSLCLIVGLDAFLGLPDWHRWEEIFGLAHVIVAQRPGSVIPAAGVIADVVSARRAEVPEVLRTQRAGAIFFSDITQLDIASTVIRELIAKGRETRFLLPDSVARMIVENGYYKNDGTKGVGV